MITGFNLVLFLLGFAVLYCVQLIFNRSVFIKILAVTYLFLVSSAIYFSFDTYKGWPTDRKQTKGVLVYALVIEPTSQNEGSIYLWVVSEKPKEESFLKNLITYDYAYTPAPRAYRLKYTSKTSSAVNNALEQIQGGQLVTIEMDATENGDPSMDTESKEQGSQTIKNKGEAENYDSLKIHIIPPEQIFKKE